MSTVAAAPVSAVRKVLKKLEIPASERYGAPTKFLNYDIIPLPPFRRNWNGWTYISVWNTGNFTPGNWSGGSSLLSLGLNIGQTMGIILVAKAFTICLSITNGWVGAKYHIGYTVFQRQVFGIYGAYFTMALREILSFVWFGSQAWMGGLSFGCMFSAFSPSFKDMKNTFPDSVPMTSKQLCGFVVFQVVCMFCLIIPPEKAHNYMTVSNFYNAFVMAAIFIWARVHAGTIGPLADLKTSLSGSELGWAWMYGMSSIVGGFAAGITNQADYSRFAVKKTSPILGCVMGLWVISSIVPLIGIVTASSMQAKYGTQYWNPNDILDLWMANDYSAGTRAAVFFASLGFVMTQLACNTFENGYAGGMDMAGMSPKYISIARGAIITSLVSWVCQPWTYYNTSSVFVTVMSSFSVFMIPLISILICDFYVIRKRKIYLVDLFTDRKDGKYYFTWGINFRALFAFLFSVAFNLPGMIHQITPSITVNEGIYNYYKGNIYFGSALAFSVYYILCRIWPIEGAGGQDDADYFGTFTEEEAAALGMIPRSQLTQDQVTEKVGFDLHVFDQMVRVGRNLRTVDEEGIEKIGGAVVQTSVDSESENDSKSKRTGIKGVYDTIVKKLDVIA